MTSWRRFGFSCVALGVTGLAMGLAGCSKGGESGAGGPLEEVKITAPVNEKGQPITIESESQPPAKGAAK